MPAKNVRVLEGRVVEALPDTMFRVQLEGSDKVILAHLSGKMRLHYIRIIPGDRVLVEVSSYDEARGRIIRRM